MTTLQARPQHGGIHRTGQYGIHADVVFGQFNR